MRSEEHFVNCRLHPTCDNSQRSSTWRGASWLVTQWDPAPALQCLGDRFGSLTQLRGVWISPWTQPFPLGGSRCCQAQGPGLREVGVPTAKSRAGCPLCPSSTLNLTTPGIWTGLHAWEGKPKLDWGLPQVPPCPDAALADQVEVGREEESMLWGLNPTFQRLGCVTSGRLLPISEPQLPPEHALFCKAVARLHQNAVYRKRPQHTISA